MRGYRADVDPVASYRKIFPRRPYERGAPGSEFVVFDMAGYGQVGSSVCFDAWFPEVPDSWPGWVPRSC